MSRKFHNLGGLLRDLQSARRAGPEGEGDAYALWTAFVDEVEYAFAECSYGEPAADAEDGDADASDELDGLFEPVSVEVRQRPRGPDARSQAPGAAASLLDTVLDGLAGEERARAQLELDALRRDALAGTQPGAKRVTRMPPIEEGG